jgi:hypothetical protein
MAILKRLLKVLALLFATYLLASVIEGVILALIWLGKGQTQTLTLNTADVITFWLIWMVLYFVLARRFLRPKKRA